jgi:hypothetical protein
MEWNLSNKSETPRKDEYEAVIELRKSLYKELSRLSGRDVPVPLLMPIVTSEKVCEHWTKILLKQCDALLLKIEIEEELNEMVKSQARANEAIFSTINKS